MPTPSHVVSLGENANPPERMRARRLNRFAVAFAALLLLPLAALAQLPTPTYGWNLGNTLEPAPAPQTEGWWGPAATQAQINAVADAGFNVIRIPCAWDTHANQSTLQIDPAWMARVKQVVDWCYAKNLYVVLNCHWDGGWLDSHIGDTPDAMVTQKMNSYWTQIATTFQGYDNHLLFAGANEPPADTAAQVATLMNYYQTFINAVRATGGTNATRWLVIQGPNTNIDKTYDMVNTLPTDSATGRLMVEIHHYPFQWTIMDKDASWGKIFYFWGKDYHSPTMLDRNSTWGEEAYTDEQFGKMATKFTSKGIPVIIGEWGVMRRFGLSDLTGTELNRHLASRTYFAKYVTEKANALGLKPIWWDAGGLGSGTMWLFDRSTAAIIDADTINALTGGPALPPPAAVAVPNAPTGLTATVASTSQVDLTWADNATNEDGLELDRATNSTFTTNLVTTTLAANTTSRSVTGLSSATTYYFRLRATNSAGASAYTSTASATTQSTPPPAPPPSSSGGGGGGGGAPSAWFLGVIALATLLRRSRTRT